MLNQKIESREAAQKEREISAIRSEVRADESLGDGIFEGYAALWDSVDSYNSVFKRGAFKKTLQERGDKIKVMHDHGEIIGKVIEIKEDDKGLFVRGKISIGTTQGKDTFTLLLDKVIDSLSFGFTPILQRFNDEGVREITEVKLFEISPVVFPANEDAAITDVRGSDFDENLLEIELVEQRYILIEALRSTLSSIWWDVDNQGLVSAIDSEISKFQAAYVSYAVDVVNSGLQLRGINDIANKLHTYCKDNEIEFKDLPNNTDMTLNEATELRKGNVIDAVEKLEPIDIDLFMAVKKERRGAVEALCAHIRSGINDAEKTRIQALLNQDHNDDDIAGYIEPEESESDIIESIRKITKQFGEG